MLRLEVEQKTDKTIFTVTARGRAQDDLDELDTAYESLMSSTKGYGSYLNSYSFTITTNNEND